MHKKVVIFKFETLDKFPESVKIVPDKKYIISCWSSNAYITGGEDNKFTINESHGDPIRLEREYVLIAPTY